MVKMKYLDENEIDVELYYTRYGPMVMRRCLKLLRDEEKAFDAMHQPFIVHALN